MRQLNYEVFNNVSIGANADSIAIDSSFVVQASVIAEITGSSPVGVLSIQGSNDMPPAGDMAPFIPTNWNIIDSINISATGICLIPIQEICYQWVRVHYQRTSGTGNITGNMKTNGY